MSLIFDTNSYASKSSISYGYGCITVECWIKHSGNAPLGLEGTLLSFIRAGSTYVTFYVAMVDGDYSIGWYDNNVISWNSRWQYGAWAEHPLHDGKVHHLAAIYESDGSKSHVYVDGVSLGAADATDVTEDMSSNAADAIWIGGNVTYGEYLGAVGDVLVDEFRLWASERSENEINKFKDIRLKGDVGSDLRLYVPMIGTGNSDLRDFGPNKEDMGMNNFDADPWGGLVIPVAA